MNVDYVLPKPKGIDAYRAHQLVYGMTSGGRPQFADYGPSILLRTNKSLAEEERPQPEFQEGSVLGFELRACVSKKRKGKHVYFTMSDWRSRHDWLNRKAETRGFWVLSVNCSAQAVRIDDQKGRKFSIDCTDFTGVLRVTDAEKFREALANGIGSTARAFGFGMLII